MIDRLARGVGWFSIGLGMTELLAAKQLTKLLGMQGSESLVRAFGVREIAHGMLTLTPEKQIGLWSRVVGDGIDIATLLKAMGSGNRKRDNVGLAVVMVMGVAAVDIIGAVGATRRHRRSVGEQRSYKDRSGFPIGMPSAKGRVRNSKAPTNVQPAPAAVLPRRPLGQRVQIH